MVVVAYLSAHIFSGRAAFLLTGAVMATSMSANVFFWIIPGQRRMVKALKAGQAPNPLDGKRAAPAPDNLPEPGARPPAVAKPRPDAPLHAPGHAPDRPETWRG
ncbi:hypothetical protein QWA_17525 [Alcaligenes faecalis subsp. faecalis NCIB 8687]|nr:hypothetical protein QWA_17525 [Alcaligenes faecalis subsp. faecalis NCIB 8687]